MQKRLSILLPSYNNECLRLVKALHSEATAILGLDFEIIVIDDASTELDKIFPNEEIASLSNCSYIKLKKNIGRASIRNLLWQTARYEYLIYIDSDRDIEASGFLSSYLNAIKDKDEIIYGGYRVNENHIDKSNLRYSYEMSIRYQQDISYRESNPNQHFNTSNFLVSKSLISRTPFDERFRNYGYEDLFWGKSLEEIGVKVRHIDNPIYLNDFEDNLSFVKKTETAMQTLVSFEEDLQGYSLLLDRYNLIAKYHLDRVVLFFANPFLGFIRNRLIKNGRNIKLFALYKLLYFIKLKLSKQRK